ncbi:MAG: thioredoxin [Gemmatimonas sp. SG8_17]|nr:MAG: thioredoxin [Gemmatimonas sp. SG8_17]
MAGTELLVEVSDDSFEEQIEQQQGVALVDFWAAWCAPCQVIAPSVAQLAEEYEGRVKVAKLDVDTNQKTAMRFNVRSIPTLLVFKDGTLVDTVVGAVPKDHLVNTLEKHL